MQSFKLDKNGDLKIKNGEIELINNEDLLYQKVQQVLSTNLGEYELGKEQGIMFKNILGKNLNKGLVRDEILRGLRQVEPNFVIEKFECELDDNRKLKIEFTATTKSKDSINFIKIYS